MTLKLPAHECSLKLEHNPHRSDYESLPVWCSLNALHGTYKWCDEGAEARAVASGELWVLQWHPDTPVAFHAIAAPTLNELLKFARDFEEN